MIYNKKKIFIIFIFLLSNLYSNDLNISLKERLNNIKKNIKNEDCKILEKQYKNYSELSLLKKSLIYKNFENKNNFNIIFKQLVQNINKNDLKIVNIEDYTKNLVKISFENKELTTLLNKECGYKILNYLPFNILLNKNNSNKVELSYFNYKNLKYQYIPFSTNLKCFSLIENLDVIFKLVTKNIK